jgi:hypothetical protein
MSDAFEWDDPDQEPEVGELRVSRTPDGMVKIKAAFDAEAGSVIDQAVRHAAAEIPRAAGTTDEQHLLDAFMEVLRRHEARQSKHDAAP